MLGDSRLFVRMAVSGFFHRVVRFNSVLYQKNQEGFGSCENSSSSNDFHLKKFQSVFKVVDSHEGKNNELS